MKSQQFCSVCKQWLDMEVVPTGDGDEDDGVIWFRCPQCQGFLPKLSGADLSDDAADSPPDAAPVAADDGEPAAAADDMPWNSPADMMAAQRAAAAPTGDDDEDEPFLPEDLPEDLSLIGGDEVDADDQDAEPAADAAPESKPGPAEPVHEYAAMLAALDPTDSAPYRPWDTFEIGQCVHHLAWDDCGVVVAKEVLPGGRKVIKCYFEEAGVVRLIEQAPR